LAKPAPDGSGREVAGRQTERLAEPAVQKAKPGREGHEPKIGEVEVKARLGIERQIKTSA